MTTSPIVTPTAEPPRAGSSADVPIPVRRLVRGLSTRVRDQSKDGYWMTGEVTDLRNGGRGALYFELIDRGTRVACVMSELFAFRATNLLRNGRRVVVFATVDLDDRDGRVRLAVTDVQVHGLGARQLKLARLREALRREGLFDVSRKRPVPAYPKCIALITGESTAARHDFVSRARRRHPGVAIVVIPAPMQGPTAVPRIIVALHQASRISADIVLIARGGGAGAELGAVFDDESLVRAVAGCRLPVVTAIGHETDRFLIDEVASLSVATPSAAADQIVPERAVLLDALASRTNVVMHLLLSRVQRSRAQLDALRARLSLVAHARVARQRAGLTAFHERLRRHAMTRCHRDRLILEQRRHAWDHCVARRLQRERTRLASLSTVLSALNPEAVLQRGFAFLTDAQGRVVSSIAAVHGAGEVTLRMHDGEVRVVVCEPSHPL